MRTIVLSNHPEEKAQRLERERFDEFKAKESAHQSKLLEGRARSTELKAIAQRDFREGRYFGWIVAQVKRVLHANRTQPPPPFMRQALREEVVWNAGEQGEAVVAQTLGAALSDDWILLKGYHNCAGEADQILVGPLGVAALEVKYVNGVVFCDGNRWWRDKYDRYGNNVQSGEPLQDRRGRSPSDQINAVADRLQDFLRKRSDIARIYRAVILSHENSQLGAMQGITVDKVLTLAGLHAANLFPGQPPQRIDVQAVAALVQQDHKFHQQRRDRTRVTRRNDPAPA